MQLLKILIIVTFVCSVSAVCSANTRAVIRVHDETIALTDKIMLGDIAEITSYESSITNALQKISLGYAPEVGIVRQISREKIRMAVAAAGFEEGSVEIKSQPQVIIRRQSQTVDLVEVRKVVEQALLTPLVARGATAQVIKIDLPARIEVPTGTIDLRASTGSLKNVFRPLVVAIEISIDGRIARRFNVNAQVEASARVFVAAMDLAEKARIRANDFHLETVRLDRDLSTYIFDSSKLRGITLTKAIPTGQPITTDAIVPDIVVKTGDVVKIIGDSNRFSISLTAEARAAGHIGDRIQVKNLQSGTLLQAIVVDEGIVRIRF